MSYLIFIHTMSNQYLKQRVSLYGNNATQKYVDAFNPIAPNIKKKLTADQQRGISGGNSTASAPPTATNELLINNLDTLMINNTDSLSI